MAEEPQDKGYKRVEKSQKHSQTIINDRRVKQILAKAKAELEKNTEPDTGQLKPQQDSE